MNRMGLAVAGALAWLLLLAGSTQAQSASTTIYGQAKKLGEGFAQLYAQMAADGVPRVLGVSFDTGLLDRLPSEPNTYSRCFDKNGNGRIDAAGECNGDFELEFPVPAELARSGNIPFKWVSVNWNPAGHPHPAPPP